MDTLIIMFLVAVVLTVGLAVRRLMHLAETDRNTRHWVRTIEQAPDHLVLPMAQPTPPQVLRAHAIRAERER
jgi:hypothetical protein